MMVRWRCVISSAVDIRIVSGHFEHIFLYVTSVVLRSVCVCYPRLLIVSPCDGPGSAIFDCDCGYGILNSNTLCSSSLYVRVVVFLCCFILYVQEMVAGVDCCCILWAHCISIITP